jgi:HEAT repeat protein
MLAAALACERASVPRPTREFGPVARERVAALEARVATEAKPADAPPDLAERIEGLLDTASASDERLARAARDELATLGSAAAPLLGAALAEDDLRAEVRAAAAEALARIDTPESAEALLLRLERARREVDPEAWMRAHCAWRLGETAQDWVVPRLILCLRYETDHEAVVWLAGALARFGNLAGLEGLAVVARTSPRAEHASLAAEKLRAIALERGFDDSNSLRAVWDAGDPEHRLGAAPFSARHELEVWRIIAGFSEWQLRGVDDGRFVLSRAHPRCAAWLAEALSDENRYVRVHAAQCLERMGPRARSTGPALTAALDDPEIACEAAAALGAIDYTPGETALIARLDPRTAYELRVAAARALGTLGRTSSVAALAPVAVREAEPLDLRVAAACALIRCDPTRAPRAALELALEHLTSGAVEPAAPEAALESWLAARAASETAARAALDAWRAVAADDPRSRLELRAEIARAALTGAR